MDPNAALQQLRDLTSDVLRESDGAPLDVRRSLAEAFQALDSWLSTGGFLPAAWERQPVAPRRPRVRRVDLDEALNHVRANNIEAGLEHSSIEELMASHRIDPETIQWMTDFILSNAERVEGIIQQQIAAGHIASQRGAVNQIMAVTMQDALLIVNQALPGHPLSTPKETG